MANSLSLVALGVGDRKTIRHNYTQFAMDVDGRLIFVECPSYLIKALEENNEVGDRPIEFTQFREVLVSHVHADTSQGLEELCWYQSFGPVNRVKLYAPRWMLEDIWSWVRVSMGASTRFDPMTNPWLGGIDAKVDLESPNPPYWPYPAGPERFDWYFDYVVTQGDQGTDDFGEFKVSSMLTRHIPRTLAFKFDFGNFKLGYSADTGYYPRLLEWLDDCDLILHEVMLSGPNEERNLHTSLDDLLTQPKSFQEKTLLCHYSDDAYDDDPAKPRYDIGSYQLLVQNRVYELV